MCLNQLWILYKKGFRLCEQYKLCGFKSRMFSFGLNKSWVGKNGENF